MHVNYGVFSMVHSLFDHAVPAKYILVVEDSYPDRFLIQDAIHKQYRDAAVMAVHSLEAALEELREDHYDIVILDLNLSDASGPQTVEKLRSHYPDIPLIVVTGLYEDGIIKQCKQFQANEVLSKSAALSGQLNSMLDKYVFHSR